MPDDLQVKTIMHLRLPLLREPFLCGFIAGGCFLWRKTEKILQIPLTKKGKMGRMKPIRKFFRERRGMIMCQRILAVLAALLALLWAAVPAYAASPAVDSAYLTREPWQNVPVTEFRADGAMGYYQIYADTDNHCLYFAVSMQDQQVEPGANTAAVALNLQVSSAKFSTRKFTFTTGADKALQSYDGIASSCNMQVEILENSGGYGIADGNAYFAIALDKSLCGPLTVRLDYNCGERGICLLKHAAFDYTLPEKTTASRNARAGTKQSTRQTTTKKKKETTTKFTYTGTVPHTTKSARKSSAQTVRKFAYTGGASTGDTEEELPVQTGGTAVLTDDTYTAAVAPTHRSTVANILIYLAIALATAAVIALVAGIIKSRKAKREKVQEKQRQEEEQEIEDYDE